MTEAGEDLLEQTQKGMYIHTTLKVAEKNIAGKIKQTQKKKGA